MSGGPRVLITGTYCSLNRGDAAMQLVCARGIAERVPGARIAIHVPFPSIDGPFYRARGLAVVPSSRRRLIRGTLQWAAMAVRSAPPPVGAYPPASESAAIRGADLVVDLSGDMLTEDYGVHVAYSHYLPLLQTLAAGVPLAVCAQSVGPFRWTTPLARRVLEGADLVTLREERSLQHLVSHGMSPERLEVTADLAFALDPARDHEIDATLRAEGIAEPGPWIGVSLSGLVERYRARKGGVGTLAAALSPALRAVAERLDATILLVPHVFGPKPAQDDRGALEALNESLGGTGRLLRGEHGPEVQKGIISRCALFVGARMHAVMAALSTGVPVLALAYSHKAVGIMGDFGLDPWVLDAGTAQPAQLEDRLHGLCDDRDHLAGEIRENAVRARKAAVRNLELLTELLPGRAG